MPTKPWRQRVGAAGDFAVEAYARYAAEVVNRVRPDMGGFRLLGGGRRRQGGDYSNIDSANVATPGAKAPPGTESVTHTAEAKRARKIISTADGNDQRRKAVIVALGFFCR